jgi:Fe-S-cluster containining protein
LASKNKWYQSGLAFSCHQCGNCCSGPGQGYVWTTLKDIEAIAAYLKMPADEFKKKYIRRVGRRYSLIEKKPSNDCIFLSRRGKTIVCEIYPVRPVQCRTWPFWTENLRSPDQWNFAAHDCAGINKGKLYPLESIEKIRNGQMETNDGPGDTLETCLEWIGENLDQNDCLDAVQEIYRQLDEKLSTSGGVCTQSGRCCRFEEYGHRLYVTTLEMLYFIQGMRREGADKLNPDLSLLDHSKCPYQINNRCSVRTYRPAGCRIYFCSGSSQEFQNELTETILGELKALHQKFDAPYYYGDWTQWLKQSEPLLASMGQ